MTLPAPVELSESERKVLSYISRGVSKDTAVDKMATFFSMTKNDVLGALNTLRKNGFVVESRGISGVTVLTTSPLRVRESMLDPRVIELLRQNEGSAKAGGFKRRTFTADADTGEVLDTETATRKQAAKHDRPDLGFEIDE